MNLQAGEFPSEFPKRFWCVENFSMAETLTQQQRDELHHHMQFKRFKAGETIYFPGDPSDTIYSIRQGKVRLAYADEHGRRLTFSIVNPGQVFGEMALAGEDTRRWSAEAIEDCVLCMISKKDLLRFAEANPRLALTISKMVGERLIEIQNKLEDLLFKGVNDRLSRTLLRLVEKFGRQSPEGTRIDLKLTHQELASLIGATRETTSTALGQLERQGLITKGHGKIIVKNIDVLRQTS